MTARRRTAAVAAVVSLAVGASLLPRVATALPLPVPASPLPGSGPGSQLVRIPPSLLPGCAQPVAGARVICSFTGIGAEQEFTVPTATATTALAMTVIGARGGEGPWKGRGGMAVLNPVPFRAGTPLYVEVGTPGSLAQQGISPGGFNGGGAGGPGRSSGGGASDVRLRPGTGPASLNSRFIVAGGGGGDAGCGSPWAAIGGDAGERGSDGFRSIGAGRDTRLVTIAWGGGAGSLSAGGSSGYGVVEAGHAGTFGQGGAGSTGSMPGCGGGGGWYGGGGSVQASGAGGGSNFLLFPGVAGVASGDQPAGVTITYQPAGPVSTIRAVPTVGRAPVGTWISLAVQALNIDGAAVADVSKRAQLDAGPYGTCDPTAPRCRLTVAGTHAIEVGWLDPRTGRTLVTRLVLTAT